MVGRLRALHAPALLRRGLRPSPRRQSLRSRRPPVPWLPVRPSPATLRDWRSRPRVPLPAIRDLQSLRPYPTGTLRLPAALRNWRFRCRLPLAALRRSAALQDWRPPRRVPTPALRPWALRASGPARRLPTPALRGPASPRDLLSPHQPRTRALLLRCLRSPRRALPPW